MTTRPSFTPRSSRFSREILEAAEPPGVEAPTYHEGGKMLHIAQLTRGDGGLAEYVVRDEQGTQVFPRPDRTSAGETEAACADYIARAEITEEAPRWIGDNAPLIGESIAADVREATETVSHLGYYEEHGRGTAGLSDAEQAKLAAARETLEAIEEARADEWRAYHFDGGPAPAALGAIDGIASFARTALTDPDALPEAAFDFLPRVLETFPPLTAPGVVLAVELLDLLINTLNPAELTTETAPAALEILGRQIEDVRARLEADGTLEPGRSMIGDSLTAAVDRLDEAIEALKGGDDD